MSLWPTRKSFLLISLGETGGFTKFHLFLSKKRGGVNTAGGAIFPRDRSLTAAAGAVYDQGGGGRRGGQSDMVHNEPLIEKRVLFTPPFSKGGLKKPLIYRFRII
jgi:hypothetical protein